MAIEWIMPKDTLGTVTFYDSNITLNKVAASYFVDAYKVIVGIDKEKRRVVIKNLNKEEAMRGDVNKNHLLDVAIKKSYGRISSKKVISDISVLTNFDFLNNNNYKFRAKWSGTEKLLIVDLDEEVKA
ncbi:hypothetical protein JN09_000827 [Acholeplasma morum]|uniref:hypothetical protein n=1 Tax=Paracholeplasma morum TaxID=264637 RepID=UPI001959F7B1|nr:hypothetical protein [Paracholeplasma morum]MBM7453497.1 hypothetical protein [Paracholeplasma morum]